MLSNSSRVTLSMIAVAVGVCSAAAAAGAPIPDSATVARLQAVADSSWRMRIVTARVVYPIVKPRVDAFGVTVRHGEGQPALITLHDAPPTEQRVAWSDIQRFDAEKSNMAPAVATGLVVGALLGGGFVMASANELDSSTEEGALAMYGVLLGGAFGGLVGMLFGLGSGTPHQIYP